MAEPLSCGIAAHRAKVKAEAERKPAYTDELADYLAGLNNTKPRPTITQGEIDEKGYWVRQPNFLITPFGDGEKDLKADKDRYIIYWNPGCNWSQRPVIVRELLGLTDVIKEEKVSHTGEHNKYGWGFPDSPNFKDPITGVNFLSDLYTNADPNYTGRATTPTFADYKEKKAVNNDYHRLTNYLEVQFRKYQPVDAPDLYPVKFRKEIDELNDWLFPNINDGHYRQAFAQSPEAYNDGHAAFHSALEKLDERLATNRFLFGDYITDSDVRAYVSLIKWETDFYLNAGPQKKRISEYKNVWEYVKELYSIPAFSRYINRHDKAKDDTRGDFSSYIFRIVSKLDLDEFLKTDHARKALSADPENLFLKHPAGETPEDYQSVISKTKWNDPSQEVRADKKFKLSVDASVNPLKGKLHN
ncbi:MAG: glutathione S-transferase C-terminal domain-containing protein [Lachnospiraceae bacterium]|nr:glutathione S-transferase C-terminal domain-containing protein [Lachnospiraceae bacterium]